MFKRLAVPCLLLSLVPACASAGGEVFGGYSFLRQLGDDSRSLHGGNAALSFGVRGPFSVTLDASGHHRSSNGVTEDQAVFMAGPSFALGRGSRLSPFVHVLAGIVRTSTGIKVFDVSISEDQTKLGGLAGGGLDLRAGGSWAVRLIQADFILSRKEGITDKGLRLSAGAVYRFGAR